MTQFPLVSIIIPCYNAAAMIERCLLSCFQQVYPHLEIILVDNNSTDQSIALAQELAKNPAHPVRFAQCTQQGTNHARNQGFALARGEYIQWLDADDELTPHKIALQVAALMQQPSFRIAYGNWEWCFYQGGRCQYRLALTSQQFADPLLQLLLDNWRPPHSYLLHRSVALQLDTLQGWHPQDHLFPDREYFTLAAILGFQFLHVPQATVRYNHWSSSQISRATADRDKVQSLKHMFLRLQRHAGEQRPNHLTAEHWFLLNQRWELWKLAPVQLIPQGEQRFWLQHQSTAAGMALTPAAARIVRVLQQVNHAYSLEDHARIVVRLFWKDIVQRVETDSQSVITEFARLLGLSESAGSVQRSPPNPSTQTAVQAYIDTIPLSAPLFEEQRLTIMHILDKLRLAEFLKPPVLAETSSALN